MYYMFFVVSPEDLLDLAQSVEHTTVTVTQTLYGRWFDSGSRDRNRFVGENEKSVVYNDKTVYKFNP
jgi:hypothetical protein